MSKESPKNKSKIKSKVRSVAEKNGLTSSYYLQKHLDVAPTVAVNLWNDDVTRFSVEILELLCEKFNCDVADLLVYTSDTKRSKPAPAPESVKGESVKVVDISELKTMDVDEVFDRLKEKVSSGDFFKNSVLDIVNSSSDNETLLSTVAVAARLNVSRKSVNDYIISGKLPAVKGKQNHNFIRESDLLAFMAKK
jgi:putative transcriptional regulator